MTPPVRPGRLAELPTQVESRTLAGNRFGATVVTVDKAAEPSPTSTRMNPDENLTWLEPVS
jgi:hypothetical protein